MQSVEDGLLGLKASVITRQMVSSYPDRMTNLFWSNWATLILLLEGSLCIFAEFYLRLSQLIFGADSADI